MWQTDEVTFQSKAEVKNLGSISITWTPTTTVLCDVQEINKELVFKSYGFTETGEYKQVFDRTLSDKWAKGDQVLFEAEQWLIMLVNGNNDKMGLSNHVFAILKKVI